MAIAKALEIYVNGVNLAKAFKNLDYQLERSMEDSTTLDSSGSRTYEAGLKNGTVGTSGVWAADTTNADEIDDLMKAAYSAGSDVNMLCSRGAVVAGEVCMMIESGLISTWNYPHDIGSLQMANAEIQSQKGIDFGEWLAKVNDTVTGTGGASNDDTTSSSTGLYFQAHAYELSDSGNTDATIKLQHSTDDAAWADLSSPAAVGSAQGAVEGTIATGVTINRYVRLFLTTVTGKGYAIGAYRRKNI